MSNHVSFAQKAGAELIRGGARKPEFPSLEPVQAISFNLAAGSTSNCGAVASESMPRLSTTALRTKVRTSFST
jgi:hypothetical protein